jgi:acyl carrier protein phosphodiesterase
MRGLRDEAAARQGPVNFVAHVTVALSVVGGSGETGLAFGAALPDLASMAGLRIETSSLSHPVREGVSIHHRTDAAFHSLVDFTSGVQHLREQLRAGGLEVGPSRAIGHAGWELLLDGCLLDRPGVAEGFGNVLDRAPDVALSVSAAEPDRWRRLLAGMRSERWWLGYRESEVVARRLHRRLMDRRRLCFDAERIPFVAAALDGIREGVDVVAEAVMSAVTEQVGDACRA